MIALSSRYALPVLVLAALTAIPIGWHAAVAPIAEPCRDAAALLASEQIGDGRVTQRSLALEGPRGTSRISGEVVPTTPSVYSMLFRISRGFVPSTFYGSGEVHLLDNTFALDAAADLIGLDAGDVRLPVHWLEDTLGSNFRVRAHFYVFDGRPVEYPFAAGIALAGRQLLGGTRPVTLFMFRAEGRAIATDAMRRDTGDWLRAAWEHYGEVCAR